MRSGISSSPVSSSLLFLNLFLLIFPSSVCLNDTNIPESPPKYNCSLMCQPRGDQRELGDSSAGPCAVSCGFLALFEAWEAVVHHHAQPEVCSQGGIWGVGLGLGQGMSALEAWGGFCLDLTQKDREGVTSGAQFSTYLKQEHQDPSANGKTQVVGPYKTCWRSSELSLLLQNLMPWGFWGVPQPTYPFPALPSPALPAHPAHTGTPPVQGYGVSRRRKGLVTHPTFYERAGPIILLAGIREKTLVKSLIHQGMRCHGDQRHF